MVMALFVEGKRPPSPLESVLAGTVSGMAAVTICHPLDVLRTRMQLASSTNQPKLSMSVLYSGFWYPFAAQAYYKAVIFSSNNFCSKLLTDYAMHPSLKTFLCGMFAGSINACVVAPVEMLRTARILGDSNNLSPSLSRLWTALLPTMVRDGPGMGLYFLAFRETRSYLSSCSSSSSHLAVNVQAGAVSGVAFWLWAIYFDTWKTEVEARLPSSPSSSSVSSMSRVGRSLRSLPIALLRGIPSAAITWVVYQAATDSLIDSRLL